MLVYILTCTHLSVISSSSHSKDPIRYSDYQSWSDEVPSSPFFNFNFEICAVSRVYGEETGYLDFSIEYVVDELDRANEVFCLGGVVSSREVLPSRF